MAETLFDATPQAGYVDRKAQLKAASPEAYAAIQAAKLARSRTVYVGNLGYFTTESQVWEHFGAAGTVLTVTMGLNSVTRQPCGFCFVEYFDQAAAYAAVNDLHLSRLDDRVIRVSWDTGDVHATARRWGRGFGGSQIRDEYRQDLDTGRGGLGVRRATEAGVERGTGEEPLLTYEWETAPAAPTAPPAAGRKHPRGH